MLTDFELLKRTYPISKTDRYCDGYEYIMNNSAPEDRNSWNCDIQHVINKGEKYIYQVAKDNNIFKVMCLSFKNYEIIRKFIFKFEDK